MSFVTVFGVLTSSLRRGSLLVEKAALILVINII